LGATGLGPRGLAATELGASGLAATKLGASGLLTASRRCRPGGVGRTSRGKRRLALAHLAQLPARKRLTACARSRARRGGRRRRARRWPGRLRREGSAATELPGRRRRRDRRRSLGSLGARRRRTGARCTLRTLLPCPLELATPAPLPRLETHERPRYNPCLAMCWTTPSGTRYHTGSPAAARRRTSVELMASAGTSSMLTTPGGSPA